MSVKIGKIQGIDIELNYSWFLIFFIIASGLANIDLPRQYPDKSSDFYWLIGVISALSLNVSVLVHELAHSILARRKGLSIKNITLHFFGGVSYIDEESIDPKTEAYVSAVGPLSSLVIGIVLLTVNYSLGAETPDSLEAIFRYVGYVNVSLAVFNLIPALPMDGGRLLRAVIWSRNGNYLRATRSISSVSKGISIVFMVLGIFTILSFGSQNGIWLVLIGIFINNGSKDSLSQTIISEALGGMTVREIMTKEVQTVEPDVSVQRIIDEDFSVYKHQGYPVLEDGELVGVITNEDVRKVRDEERDSTAVRDVMIKRDQLITVSPDEKASDALMLMATRDVGRLLVIDDDNLVGIITRSDINRTIKMKTELNHG